MHLKDIFPILLITEDLSGGSVKIGVLNIFSGCDIVRGEKTTVNFVFETDSENVSESFALLCRDLRITLKDILKTSSFIPFATESSRNPP